MEQGRLEIKNNQAHVYGVPWEYTIHLADGEASPRPIEDFLHRKGIKGKMGAFVTTWYNCPDEWEQYGWQGSQDIDMLFIHPGFPGSYEEKT